MSALANDTAFLPSSNLVVLRELVSCGTGASQRLCEAAAARSESRSSRTFQIVSRSFPEVGESV